MFILADEYVLSFCDLLCCTFAMKMNNSVTVLGDFYSLTME